MAENQDAGRKGFSFTWILENVPYFWHKKGEKIVSPAFIVNTMENTKWRLWLYPRGEDNENFMSYYLFREESSKGPWNMKIDCDLSLLDSDGSTVLETKCTGRAFLKGKGFGWRDFCKRENAIAAKETLKNILTIRCRMWKAIGIVSRDGVCFARTRIGVERRSFVWEIYKFSTLPCNDKRNVFRIKSASNDELIMTLNLFLVADWHEIIRIDCTTTDPNISLFTLKVAILDAQGRALECCQDNLWFDSVNTTRQLTFSQPKEKLMAKKSVYLSRDILTLQCECTFSNKVLSEEIENLSYGLQIRNAVSADHNTCSTNPMALHTISALKTDLSSLFSERTFCDVKLRTKTEVFPAHWLLLSARSPVFRAMYSSDMKEKARDSVYIPDLDADTVRRMLLYIYSDSLEDVQWEKASQLYVAADKYAIVSLKNECSAFLKDNLCGNNACEILVLADMHSDNHLKRYVQDFVIKHDKDIIKSSNWKLLMETHAKLAAETMFLKYKE